MKKSNLKYLAFASLTACVLASCGQSGGADDSTTTTLSVLIFNGTGGKEWVTEAASRFSQANADVSFQDGKKGIKIRTATAKGITWTEHMRDSGYDVYIYETNPDMYQLSAQNYLLDLSDVVEPIKDKIEVDLLERMKGTDGKYYGLPHYEWFPGLTYDKDLFDDKNLYFADPSVEAGDKETYSCKYGSADFVAAKDVTKSVGPNGVKGDYDDGLPSSLEELCVLFDKMKDLGISPMVLCGSGHRYSWYLPIALWASLTGGDGMRDVYCNWTDAEVDVVTETEGDWKGAGDLFYSGSSIKKPTTKKVKLDDNNGYQIYSMANRYYALAFFQNALNENWLDSEQLADSNGSASQAQKWFVNGYNTRRFGTIWEGSYWCHEATDVGAFKTYKAQHPSSPDRHTAFMPLPTQLEGQVTEGNGKKPTLLNVGSTMVFANARTVSAGTDKAAKEFIKFIYSDNELAAFSEKTGLTVPMSYSYDMSKLNNSYYSDLATLRKDADVVQCSSASTRFKKNLSSFIISYDMKLTNFDAGGVGITGGYLDAFKKYGSTADDIFDKTKISESTWSNMSK